MSEALTSGVWFRKKLERRIHETMGQIAKDSMEFPEDGREYWWRVGAYNELKNLLLVLEELDKD